MRERDARRVRILGESRRVEDIESAGTAEAQTAVAQAIVGVVIELLALQPCSR
jgi:hypothetical protein